MRSGKALAACTMYILQSCYSQHIVAMRLLLPMQAAQDQLVVDALQNQVLVKLNDGSVVSLWDLYNYVEHNPELAAIAAKGVNAFDDGSTP